MANSTAPTKLRGHVALCPFPFTSHPALMLLLARKIAATAPDVQLSLFTTEPSASVLSAGNGAAGVRIWRIDNGMTSSGPIEALTRFVETAGESLRKAMAEAEEVVGVKITCVVADAMVAFVCRHIAEERGIKWVALWIASSSALAAHLHTDHLRDAVAPEGLEAHQEEKVDDHIPGFTPKIPLKDLPYEILGADYDFPIARVLQLMPHHLHRASAVLVNSFPSLEVEGTSVLSRIFHDKLLTAGPYAFTISPSSQAAGADPHGCLPWLDTHAASPGSVIYIGFGTGHPPPPEELASLAEALEETRVPFLWSLPDKFRSSLPEDFIGRVDGKVVPWAPQASVLGHEAIGFHMTHCGWNSALESVVMGVPMICRPLKIADNVFNTRMVGSDGWGIGMAVEDGKMTKPRMVAIFETLMRGEGGRRAREKIGAMKKLAEQAIHDPNGSTSNLDKYINIITS